jgi:hypothetical protein
MQRGDLLDNCAIHQLVRCRRAEDRTEPRQETIGGGGSDGGRDAAAVREQSVPGGEEKSVGGFDNTPVEYLRDLGAQRVENRPVVG